MFIWNRCSEVFIISINMCRYIKANRKVKSLHCEVPVASCTLFVCLFMNQDGVGCFVWFSMRKSLLFYEVL